MLRSVRARRAMRTSANSHTHKQTQADVLDKMLLIWNPIKMWVATSSSVTNSSRRLSSTHDWLQANPSGTCARATVRSLQGGKKKEKRKNEIKQHQRWLPSSSSSASWEIQQDLVRRSLVNWKRIRFWKIASSFEPSRNSIVILNFQV